MQLILTVDTEADNQWNVHAPLTTANLLRVPRLQQLCDEFGFAPTYLCTYEVVTSDAFAETVTPHAADGRAEIGAHLHPLPQTGGAPFDFVLVDGPPARTVGRFMGLPLLWPRLAIGALVLVDDANRRHLEGVWIDLWRRLYGDALRVEIYPGFQKGLALMMKTTDTPRAAHPALWTRWARAAVRHEARRLVISIRERTPRW